MREIRVAIAQTNPRLGDVEGNTYQMKRRIEEICGSQEVNLIVFPELCTTGYECGMGFTDLAESIPGALVNIIGQHAEEYGVYVAFGMAAKAKVESILYDAAVLVGPEGELAGAYHKVHLKGEERLAFRPGFRYPVLETDFGLVGLMLGWDLAFPEVARSYALDGAELLCVLANWEKPNENEWRSYVYSRAYENAVFVAAANRVGAEPSYEFLGGSRVVGPRGKTHAIVEGDSEGFMIAHIDLDEVRKVREDAQLIQCRQPRTYRNIVKMY
ncbi:MAG: carbon-nitrogen hydrolase family protein [Chloroflexi bacterium]|nr:carbon-nitrogen hydrolase family protein [Chloroflexota bacterium]MBU1747364.1 carbon-nitrogen hydrolase family protein [Chloroflexota bacterium]